ncbi:Transcription factor IIIC, subunit 5, putative isoform 2 [Hibiscus syriacus]|uniref:Transcription factor IIIC, subunit 5, putative isoform 2 n=1 Tax=Hibiscus syriacus TaxID=106335 RepID=A0A6A3BXT3_HIBSY|nr:Transcription factor IIIC, subunit 5, putative isoform 2 [Hibiscus syriacus]
MGVIKEGRVSGTLPNSEAFAVHYPGYPKTADRAIQTLGGTEGILKARFPITILFARSSLTNRLELHFRPEDPFSHPAFGDLRPCSNLLLRISKKKCSNGKTTEASSKLHECSTSGVTDSENTVRPPQVEVQRPEEEEEGTELCADIVSRISEAYNFDGMADYQHVLPVHADDARKRKRNWEEAEEPSFEKGGFMDEDQGDVMMILPPLFSPKDIPENVVLRPSTILSSKKKQEGVVQFSAEVPKTVNWEELITQGSEQWEWQMIVSKLFDERPIWPKESITERLLEKSLKFSHLVLKRLLLGVAYYFSNGPFLRFWIRKGYDPRKDPESRIYQRTEFRAPEPLRSYADASAANNLKHKWGDLCSFQVFPYKCHTLFQLFELDDDYIQQEIRKPPKLVTCNPKTGWFSECMLDCLRLRVAVRFLSIYPEAGAESILKSYSDEFEKLKRSCMYKDVFNSQEEHRQTNKGDEDKERPKNSDNEEDEVEADDEEELDMYETLNLDDEISLQPDTCILESRQSAFLESLHLLNRVVIWQLAVLLSMCRKSTSRGNSGLKIHYHLLFYAMQAVGTSFCNDLDMENNSRTYLQELFGSFPSTVSGAADAIQAADGSDGEYQIYEQFSDNNYSDDDDEDDGDDDDGGDDN